MHAEKGGGKSGLQNLMTFSSFQLSNLKENYVAKWQVKWYWVSSNNDLW